MPTPGMPTPYPPTSNTGYPPQPPNYSSNTSTGYPQPQPQGTTYTHPGFIFYFQAILPTIIIIVSLLWPAFVVYSSEIINYDDPFSMMTLDAAIISSVYAIANSAWIRQLYVCRSKHWKYQKRLKWFFVKFLVGAQVCECKLFNVQAVFSHRQSEVLQ